MPSRNRQNLKSLQMLLTSTPEGLTAEEIAQQLNVSRQTVYNNLRQLEEDGHPVYQNGSLWCLDVTQDRILHLSLAETWMLYLPLRRITRAQLHRYPLVRDLLNKVIGLFRETEIADQLVPDIVAHPDHEVSDNFSRLVDGWRDRTLMRVGYRKPNATQVSELMVAPYWFEPAVWTDGFYLVAGIRQSNGRFAPITLKLERIQYVQATSEAFDLPPVGDLTAQVAMTWGIWQSDDAPTHVILRFHNRHFDRLRETRWHPSEKIHMESSGDVIWEGHISEPQEMTPWIRSWGADVEVVEPQHIRNQIAAEAAATARLYGVDSGDVPDYF